MRHETLLQRDATAVIIIDLQEKILPAVADPAATLRKGRMLAAGAGVLRLPLLVTEQYPQGLGRTVAELRGALPPDLQCHEKTAFSALADPDFRDALAATGARQVLVAGIETHICVLQTALDLQIHGYQAHLAADACGSRDPANHDNALQRLQAAGVIISNVESALFELLGAAGGGEFKEISRLVR